MATRLKPGSAAEATLEEIKAIELELGDPKRFLPDGRRLPPTEYKARRRSLIQRKNQLAALYRRQREAEDGADCCRPLQDAIEILEGKDLNPEEMEKVERLKTCARGYAEAV